MTDDWAKNTVEAASEKSVANDRTQAELMSLLEGVGSSKRMTPAELDLAAARLLNTLMKGGNE